VIRCCKNDIVFKEKERDHLLRERNTQGERGRRSRTRIITTTNNILLLLLSFFIPSLLFLSSESDVINIKMSLVDFQLFLRRFPTRENKDASSSSLHVMTFGIYMYVYICSSTSSVSHESAIINRHILVQS